MSKEFGWERKGDPANYIINDFALLENVVAKDVQEQLSEEYADLDMLKYGDEDPYGWEAQYAERGPDDSKFQESWRIFRHEVISRARFYSQEAERFLNEIFNDIYSLKTFDRKSVVSVRGPKIKERYIHRARMAQSAQRIKRILQDPVNELGAPVPRKARSGRMNAKGISVLYGAEDQETCIAEIRPLVGSHVVLGTFEIIRDIRLLDFDLLTKVYVESSYFDPKYTVRLQKGAFLRRLITELTQPVMPNDEVFGKKEGSRLHSSLHVKNEDATPLFSSK